MFDSAESPETLPMPNSANSVLRMRTFSVPIYACSQFLQDLENYEIFDLSFHDNSHMITIDKRQLT